MVLEVGSYAPPADPVSIPGHILLSSVMNRALPTKRREGAQATAGGIELCTNRIVFGPVFPSDALVLQKGFR